jgi:hypothetical protein
MALSTEEQLELFKKLLAQSGSDLETMPNVRKAFLTTITTKPLTGYQRFLKAQFDEVRGMDLQVAVASWRALTDEEKAEWNNKGKV